MELLQIEMVNIAILIFAGVIGVISKYLTSFLKKKGLLTQLQNNKEIANIVVNAVEQTYRHLKGAEKLNKAKLEVVKLAKSKGLKVTEKELDLLIEASVKEMNSSIKREMK